MAKNFKLAPFAIALLAASVSVAHAKQPKMHFKTLSPQEVKELPTFLKQGYESGMFKIKDSFKVPGTHMTGYAVYSAVKGDGLFYTQDGNLFIGNLVNKQGVNLTNKYLAKYATPTFYTEKMKYIKSAHTVTYGHGKTQLVSFVDPRCPHCVQEELDMLLHDKSFADKYTLKAIPVGFVAPNSDELGKNILDAVHKGKSFPVAWKEALQKANLIKNVSGDKRLPVIQDNLDVMQKMGINQTPTTIRYDDKLKEWVGDNNIFRP